MLANVLASALPDRNSRIALIFLAAVFGFGRLDLPQAGFAVVAVASAGMGVWILLRHRLTTLITWLGVVVAVAMSLPAIIGMMRGQDVSTGQIAFGLALGVAVWATALIPPGTVRWSALALLGLVTWGGLVAGAFAELGIFSYGLFPEPAQDRRFFGLIQLRGVMPHPNTMGIFAGLGLVLSLRQVLTDLLDGVRRTGPTLALLLGVALPSTVVLVWSQSRTSAIAALAGLVVALLPLQRPSWHWVPPVVAMFAGLMITIPVIIAETVGYDFNGRGIPWALAQSEFESSPFIGRGPEFLSDEYRANLELLWQPETAHNMLMQAIGEAGLIGLLSLAAVVLVMCLIAVQAVPFDRQWALIVVVMFCVLGGQESTLSLPVRSALLIQLAIIASSAVLLSRGAGSASSERTAPAEPLAARS